MMLIWLRQVNTGCREMNDDGDDDNNKSKSPDANTGGSK